MTTKNIDRIPLSVPLEVTAGAVSHVSIDRIQSRPARGIRVQNHTGSPVWWKAGADAPVTRDNADGVIRPGITTPLDFGGGGVFDIYFLPEQAGMLDVELATEPFDPIQDWGRLAAYQESAPLVQENRQWLDSDGTLTWGPFNVQEWHTTTIAFRGKIGGGPDYDVTVRWKLEDGTVIGSRTFGVYNTEQQIVHSIPNVGPLVEISAIKLSGASFITMVVLATNRSVDPASTGSEVPIASFRGVIASGATHGPISIPSRYAGPASLAFVTAAATYSARIEYHEFLGGGWLDLWGWNNAGTNQSVLGPLYVPPRRLRYTLINNTASNQQFALQWVPSLGGR